MKLKLFLTLAMILGLAGCGVFGKGTSPALPTVALDGNSATPRAPGTSQSNFSGITASGMVVPAQQAQLASSLGGSAMAVKAAVGDQVKAGQVLVTLAGGEKLSAALEAARLELLTAQQAVKALNENAAQARSAAQLRLANAQKALDTAKKHQTWNTTRIGSTNQVDTARANLVVAEDLLRKAEDRYSKVAWRDDADLGKATALRDLAAARAARDQAQYNLNYLVGTPDPFEAARVDAELAVAQTELDAAQHAYDTLKNGPDPDALALAQARVANAQSQVDASQAALSDLELKAPFAGTITAVNIHSGEWVVPGQPLLVLTDLDHLRIETKDLSELDIPQVALGQTVSVSIKALNLDVPGKVSDIASLADTLGGDVVYKTTVELDKRPDGLRAGMSVEVHFSAGQ